MAGFFWNNRFLGVRDYNGKDITIIDRRHLERNYSLVPSIEHSYYTNDTGNKPINKFYEQLLQEYDGVDIQSDCPPSKLSVLLAIALLTKECMSRNKARHILEITCDNGVLSYFITKVAAFFGRINRVYCQTEEIALVDTWLRIMCTLGEDIGCVSKLVMQCDSPCLRSDFFDFIVINDSRPDIEASALLANTIRCVRRNAMIVLMPTVRKAVAECFETFFEGCSECETYAVDYQKNLLCYRVSEEIKNRVEDNSFESLAARDNESIARIVMSFHSLRDLSEKPVELWGPELTAIIDCIKNIQTIILKNYDYYTNQDIKTQFYTLKEHLINCLVSESRQDKEHFLALFLNYLSDLQQCNFLS